MWPFNKYKHRSPFADLDLAHVQYERFDHPYNFGYKCSWYALHTEDTVDVLRAIGLKRVSDANWEHGIKAAYSGRVFVSPPILGWALVAGQVFCDVDDPQKSVTRPLLSLSEHFAEACFFRTHRVVDYHVYAKAIGGRLVRGYGYIGESCKTLWSIGDLTKEDLNLGLIFTDERCPEAKEDSFWERDDIRFPREDDVMEIARAWPVTPCDLESFDIDTSKFGVVGPAPRFFRNV